MTIRTSNASYILRRMFFVNESTRLCISHCVNTDFEGFVFPRYIIQGQFESIGAIRATASNCKTSFQANFSISW